MTGPILGTGPDGSLALDLGRLLVSHLLIQANSGGGKSWLLRRLAEQAFGRVPIVIIDPEGEFSSLREKFGFVLVGQGGDTPADVRSAPQLALKLRELGASAVCDLFELEEEERHLWVRAFLRSLDHSPKALWRDMLLIVDEAQLFAPEKGEEPSPAGAAMKAIATRGRKRGIGLVAATQRIGIFNKNVAAQLQNVLIGQTYLDIDQERAAKALGIRGAARAAFYDEIKGFSPGTFFGQGRAVSLDRVRIRVGAVQTTHPEPGNAKHGAAPPPPPAKIRHLLPQLTDLPQSEESEEPEEAAVPGRRDGELSRLRRELQAAERRMLAPRVEHVPFVPPELVAGLSSLIDDVGRLATSARQLLSLTTSRMTVPTGTAEAARAPAEPRRPEPATPRAAAGKRAKTPVTDAARPAGSARGALVRGERLIITVLATQHPKSLSRSQIGRLTGMPPKGHTMRTYLGKLATAGLIQKDPKGGFAVTDRGLAAAGPVQRPATAQELVALWRDQLTGKAKDMLELFAAEHGPLTTATVAQRLGLEARRNTLRTYLGHLQANELIRKTTGGFVVAPELAL